MPLLETLTPPLVLGSKHVSTCVLGISLQLRYTKEKLGARFGYFLLFWGWQSPRRKGGGFFLFGNRGGFQGEEAGWGAQRLGGCLRGGGGLNIIFRGRNSHKEKSCNYLCCKGSSAENRCQEHSHILRSEPWFHATGDILKELLGVTLPLGCSPKGLYANIRF